MNDGTHGDGIDDDGVDGSRPRRNGATTQTVEPEFDGYPLDVSGGATAEQARNRARIVVAVVVATAILIFGIFGIFRLLSPPATQAAASVEPTTAAGGPEPAGTLGPGPYNGAAFASTTPTPSAANPYGTPDPLAARQASDQLGYAQQQQQSAAAQRQLQAQQLAQQQAALDAQQRANVQLAQQAQQNVPAIGASQQQAEPQRMAASGEAARTSGEFTVDAPPSGGTGGGSGGPSSYAQGGGYGANPSDGGSGEYSGSRGPEVAHADRQVAFIRAQGGQDTGYVAPVSQYLLNPTTAITARLISDINSDLPGPVEAVVTQRVYTSRGHRIVVIPEGTRILGNYDSAVISGQNRLLMAFSELDFANGCSFHMGAQPGTDAEGRAGFSGKVDNHSIDFFRQAFLLTVLGVAEGLLVPQNTSVLTTPTVTQQASQNAGQQLSQIGNRLINRSLDRQPTITIDTPYEFQIMVTKPLPLDEYQTAGGQCFPSAS